MERVGNLTTENFALFAAQHYYSVDQDEFNEDIKRIKYIKRLLNRYQDTGNPSERLLLNHLIVLFNVFSIPAALQMLELKIAEHHWPVLKPFLVFLKAITNDQYTGISQDATVVDALRKI